MLPLGKYCDPEPALDLWPYVVLIIIIVVLALVLIILGLRKKRDTEKEPEVKSDSPDELQKPEESDDVQT
ncbi:MAG: hypothetical protein V3U51_04825 [Thermoplasmata archaeon]